MFKHRHNALLKHPGYNYGGDGGGTYYENAEKLYGVQADTAKFMYQLGKRYVPGAVKQYKAATDQFSSPEYEAKQVGKAVTTANTAQANATGALKRDMARYGINPASGRFRSVMGQNAVENAAMTANAANTARANVEDKRFGVAKDFYNNLVGMPSDAASTAGSAASGYAQMGANKDAAANQEAAGWGSAIGLGASYFLKDGGEVKKDKPPQEPSKLLKMLGFGLAREAAEKVVTRPRNIDEELKKQGYKDGGCVSGKYGVKMARGGLMPAFGNDQQPLPPPPAAPQQGGGAGAGIVQGVQTGKKLKDAMSGAASDKIMGGAAKGLGTLADVTGNTALAETALGAAGAGAEQAGMLVAQNAGIEGATAATAEALGAGTAAAGEAAAVASPALSAVSAAIPWIGAAVAVGSMFDLFADGGEVNRDDMTRGGEVDGPGTETSDDVPAWLSDGEYVLNAEAVQMVGKDKLDRINEAGLAKRGDHDKMPTEGPDGAMEYNLGSFIGGLATGYTTGQRIKSDKEEREYRREEMKDRRDEREYQRKKREDRVKLDTAFATGMEQAQTQAEQSGGTLYKAGEMVFDNKEDQQAALGILAKEDARIKQQPGFGVNPDAAKFLEQQPELAELRKPKMDADYLFYTTMWPKLKADYAKEYGLDKMRAADKDLLEAAEKNHNRRIIEAATLHNSGDQAGTVQKWMEIYNRDLPNGTFANGSLRSDGNVDITIYDMTGKQIDKKVVPYPDAISMAKSVIGTEHERLKIALDDQKAAKDKAYYQKVAGAKTADEAASIAAASGRDPGAAKGDYLKAVKTQADLTKPTELGGDIVAYDEKQGKYVKTGKVSPKPATTVNYTGTGSGGGGGSGAGATGAFAKQTVEALTPLIGKDAATALAYGKGKMTMPADKRVTIITGLMKQTDMMGKPLYDRASAESMVDSMFDFGTRRVDSGGKSSSRQSSNPEYYRYKEARQRAYAKGDMDGVRRMDAQAKQMGIIK